MNNELILDLQRLEIDMKRIALRMLDIDDLLTKQHAHELYGASEIVYQWIRELEGE